MNNDLRVCFTFLEIELFTVSKKYLQMHEFEEKSFKKESHVVLYIEISTFNVNSQDYGDLLTI